MIDCYLNETTKRKGQNMTVSINVLVDTIMSFYLLAKKNGVIDIDDSRKILTLKLNKDNSHHQIDLSNTSIPEIDNILDSHASFLKNVRSKFNVNKINDFMLHDITDNNSSETMQHILSLESKLKSNFEKTQNKYDDTDFKSDSDTLTVTESTEISSLHISNTLFTGENVTVNNNQKNLDDAIYKLIKRFNSPLIYIVLIMIAFNILSFLF